MQAFINNFKTTLTAGISNSATTMTLTNMAPFAHSAVDRHWIFTIKEGANIETVLAYKPASTDTEFQLTRGLEGGTSYAFTTAAEVSINITQGFLNRIAPLLTSDIFEFDDVSSKYLVSIGYFLSNETPITDFSSFALPTGYLMLVDEIGFIVSTAAVGAGGTLAITINGTKSDNSTVLLLNNAVVSSSSSAAGTRQNLSNLAEAGYQGVGVKAISIDLDSAPTASGASLVGRFYVKGMVVKE